MRTVAVFFAGVVTAVLAGLVVIEGWVHLKEHTAYTKVAR